MGIQNAIMPCGPLLVCDKNIILIKSMVSASEHRQDSICDENKKDWNPAAMSFHFVPPLSNSSCAFATLI